MNTTRNVIAATVVALAGVSAIPLASADPFDVQECAGEWIPGTLVDDGANVGQGYDTCIGRSDHCNDPTMNPFWELRNGDLGGTDGVDAFAEEFGNGAEPGTCPP